MFSMRALPPFRLGLTVWALRRRPENRVTPGTGAPTGVRLRSKARAAVKASPAIASSNLVIEFRVPVARRTRFAHSCLVMCVSAPRAVLTPACRDGRTGRPR
jgi:hypothetical protein